MNRFLAEKFLKDDIKALTVMEDMGAVYEDLINLSFGDPDLTTDEKIIEAALIEAKAGHTHYTHSLGYLELREELSKLYKEEYNYYVDISDIMLTVGANHGMFLALSAIINPGDEVIIHEPYFTPYKSQIELIGGKAVIVPTYEENNFEISLEDLKSSITKKTKAIIINSPCNPTGAYFSKNIIKGIAKLSIEHDLVIISDEVYSAFCFEEKFMPIILLEGMKERTITINSFSKNFAMTGWRVGYVIAPKYIIDCMKNINENVCYSVCSVSQRAALNALKMKEDIEPLNIKEYKDRLIDAYEALKNISGISINKPKGTFYLFPCIKGTGLSSEEFSKRLLKETHVLVIPGTMFGNSGEGYIRIACTVDGKKLKDAIERISSFVKVLNKQKLYINRNLNSISQIKPTANLVI